MGFLGDIAGGLVSSIPLVGPQISSAMGLSTTPSMNFDLGSIAGNLAGDWLGNKYINQPAANSAWAQSKEGATTQFERAKDMYKNRYQWTMKDMKKAGLNPMLAAKGGPMVGSPPTVSSAKGFMAHPSLGKTATAVRDIKDSAKSVQAAFKMRAEMGLITTQERKVAAELDKVSAEVMKAQAEISRIRAATDLTETQRQKEKELIRQTRYNADKLKYSLEKLRHIDRMYHVPYVGPTVAAIKEILGSIPVGLLVGGKGTKTDSFTEYGKGWSNTTTRRK